MEKGIRVFPYLDFKRFTPLIESVTNIWQKCSGSTALFVKDADTPGIVKVLKSSTNNVQNVADLNPVSWHPFPSGKGFHSNSLLHCLLRFVK